MKKGTTKDDKIIAALDEQDQLLLAQVLMDPKQTDEELGAIIGMGRQAVNKRRKSPKFRAAYWQMVKPLNTLKRYIPQAINYLVRLIQDGTRGPRKVYDQATGAESTVLHDPSEKDKDRAKDASIELLRLVIGKTVKLEGSEDGTGPTALEVKFNWNEPGPGSRGVKPKARKPDSDEG